MSVKIKATSLKILEAFRMMITDVYILNYLLMTHNNIELAHINQFIKLMGYSVPANNCNPPDPDFRIELNNKVIGIEHTRLFLPKDSKGDDLTKHRTIGNRIVANAERMFKEIHKEKLTVYVNFFCSYGLSIPSNMLTGKDEKLLSAFVYDFVKNNIPIYNSDAKFENFNVETGEQQLHDKIDHISIYHKYDCWSSAEGGMVPDIRGEVLDERVKTKDSKLMNYSKTFDELWLLLVENQWDLLNYFDFSYADIIDVNSRFNKVFILRSGNNQIFECNNTSDAKLRWKGSGFKL